MGTLEDGFASANRCGNCQSSVKNSQVVDLESGNGALG
jgi:hypothetical protein